MSKDDINIVFGPSIISTIRSHVANEISTSGKTISSMYCVLLVIIYGCFTYLEVTKGWVNKGEVGDSKYNNWMEINGFCIYMYGVSVLYLIYLLYSVLKGSKIVPSLFSEIQIFDNHESHGKFAVRLGIVLFGICAIIQFAINWDVFFTIIENIFGCCFLQYADVKNHTTYISHYHIINGLLGIIFTILQIYIIVMFPRLNIQCHVVLNNFGTKHIVATNMVLWMESIANEFKLEKHWAEKYASYVKKKQGIEEIGLNMTTTNPPVIVGVTNDYKVTDCEKYFDKDILLKSLTFVYAFVIEFALMGACVFLIMAFHINKPDVSKTANRKISRPRPKSWFQKSTRCENSNAGGILGAGVTIILVVSISLFYQYKYDSDKGMKSEIVSHSISIVLSLIGITTYIHGSITARQLNELNERCNWERGSFDLDLALLRLSSASSVVFSILIIITGTFSHNNAGVPCISKGYCSLLIGSGCLEVIQVGVQTIFLASLRRKNCPNELRSSLPGRQHTMFSFIFNLIQWIFLAFQVHKTISTISALSFFGKLTWILAKSVLLPVSIFFRFHSAILSIELWKGVYKCQPPVKPLHIEEYPPNKPRVVTFDEIVNDTEEKLFH